MQGREGGAVCSWSTQRTVLLTRSSGRVTLGRSCASPGFRLSSVQMPCSRPFRVGVQTRWGTGGTFSGSSKQFPWSYFKRMKQKGIEQKMSEPTAQSG